VRNAREMEVGSNDRGFAGCCEAVDVENRC
jgi:hypothetical protein